MGHVETKFADDEELHREIIKDFGTCPDEWNCPICKKRDSEKKEAQKLTEK